MISETQHKKSCSLKFEVSCCIQILPQSMHAAIQFDNEFPLHADEIDDEAPNGVLPAEFVAVELMITKA